MRFGRRVAIDVGTARIGIAASDAHCILSSGVATVKRNPDLAQTIQLILEAVRDIEPIEIYVGLPVALSGNDTSSTRDAVMVAKALADKVSISVRMVDERMTTVTAAAALRLSDRSSKSGRSVIDQIAATVILDQAIDFEKQQDKTPGVLVGDIDD